MGEERGRGLRVAGPSAVCKRSRTTVVTATAVTIASFFMTGPEKIHKSTACQGAVAVSAQVKRNASRSPSCRTRDEARRIAADIAKLSELLRSRNRSNAMNSRRFHPPILGNKRAGGRHQLRQLAPAVWLNYGCHARRASAGALPQRPKTDRLAHSLVLETRTAPIVTLGAGDTGALVDLASG